MFLNCRFLLGLAASAVLAAPLLAQAAPTPADSVSNAFQVWQNEHGNNWFLRTAPETGAGRFLYGGGVVARLAPVSDAEYEALARDFLSETSAIFGLADSTLRLSHVKTVELSRIGSRDKTAVLFDHQVNGVPVLNGYTSVVFSEGGVLVAIDSTGLPGIEKLDTTPALDPFTATTAAAAGYVELEHREPIEVHGAELVILKQRVGSSYQGRLAWAIEMHTPVQDGLPSGRRMYVAADNSRAELIGNDQLVHTQGISGTVNSWLTPGVRPDVSNNPEVLEAMRFMDVRVGATTTQTNEFGDFNVPGATGTQNVTVSYEGPFVNVDNVAGANYSLTQSATAGTPISMAMNPSRTELITAEANAYHHVIEFRQWVRATDPGDAKMDFQIQANVNLNSNCNAFFNGGSINMFTSGGGCVNTSYSTVVAHEEGHWANVIYGTGNGPDGMGEGGADVWAMFINDTPIVGEEFFGQGGAFIRTGLNTRQFCGDNNPGCHPGVHANGEVLMGAFWKARANIVATHGASGKDISDALMLAWFNVFNDTEIKSIVEEHLVILDDDDNNLANGTPNFADIDNGFRAQGFPGVALPVIDFQHTSLPNTTNETGPYTAVADIQSLVTGGSIVSARVKYRVNGGPEQTINMTNMGGTMWSGDIPGQASPSVVTYNLEATDNFNQTRLSLEEGEYFFEIGRRVQLYFSDFEAQNDEGWIHGQVAVTDDWERGAPQGKSGSGWSDPSSAYSGSKCWGNDLGAGAADGQYETFASNWLESPSIDCSNTTGVYLTFQRWLGVEGFPADIARIRVNGQTIWSNPDTGSISDTQWQEFRYDVSSIANNNPDVRVRFELLSNSSLVELGGWNIDDFGLHALTAVGDIVVLTGPSSAPVGSTVNLSFGNGSPNSPYWIYWSRKRNGSTINGHPFDIGPVVKTLTTGTTNGGGAASWTSSPIPSKAAGLTIYIEVRVDDLGAGKTLDSNVLTLSIQ